MPAQPALRRLLAKKVDVKPDDTVCAVLCGGNIDANLLARVLEQVLVRQGRYIMLKLLVLDRPGKLADAAQSRRRDAVPTSSKSFTAVRCGSLLSDASASKCSSRSATNEHAPRGDPKHLEDAGYHVEREGQGDWEE